LRPEVVHIDGIHTDFGTSGAIHVVGVDKYARENIECQLFGIRIFSGIAPQLVHYASFVPKAQRDRTAVGSEPTRGTLLKGATTAVTGGWRERRSAACTCGERIFQNEDSLGSAERGRNPGDRHDAFRREVLI
jgi:hypothetical protein